MSDYLHLLVERAVSAPAAVRPARLSLFEPVKTVGALAGELLSPRTEPISAMEDDLRATSEAGAESQSIHDRVASIPAIRTVAITSVTPPKTEAEPKRTSADLVPTPVVGPAASAFAAESHDVMEAPDKSPRQQPAIGPRPAQRIALRHRQQPFEDAKFAPHPLIHAETKVATPPVRASAAQSDANVEASTESRHNAAASRIVQGLTSAPPAAHPLMPAVAAVPVAPIKSRARAPWKTAFATNAEVPRAPTIHVSIGRVEVRAIMPAVQVKPPPERSAPKLSLDDYLRSRNGVSA